MDGFYIKLPLNGDIMVFLCELTKEEEWTERSCGSVLVCLMTMHRIEKTAIEKGDEISRSHPLRILTLMGQSI